MVWLNNKTLGFHESGHLPFEFDITDNVLSSNNNKKFHLVIAVNNTLNLNTIPPAGFFHGDDIKYRKMFFLLYYLKNKIIYLIKVIQKIMLVKVFKWIFLIMLVYIEMLLFILSHILMFKM